MSKFTYVASDGSYGDAEGLLLVRSDELDGLDAENEISLKAALVGKPASVDEYDGAETPCFISGLHAHAHRTLNECLECIRRNGGTVLGDNIVVAKALLDYARAYRDGMLYVLRVGGESVRMTAIHVGRDGVPGAYIRDSKGDISTVSLMELYFIA